MMMKRLHTVGEESPVRERVMGWSGEREEGGRMGEVRYDEPEAALIATFNSIFERVSAATFRERSELMGEAMSAVHRYFAQKVAQRERKMKVSL